MRVTEELEVGRKRRGAGWLSAEQLHRTLAAFHHKRFRPGGPGEEAEEALREQLALGRLELAFLAAERTRALEGARGAPAQPGAFVDWFLSLARGGPGPEDALAAFLCERAGLPELRWYLLQEGAAEASWEDVLALAGLQLPTAPRQALTRLYWEAMGQGGERTGRASVRGMLARELGVCPTAENTVWEAVALDNLLLGLSTHRSYAFHALGALCLSLLTAPDRAAPVEAGLLRLGVESHLRRPFAARAQGTREAVDFCRAVLLPLVDGGPEVAGRVAEGALMRLQAETRYAERMRKQLGLDAPTVH